MNHFAKNMWDVPGSLVSDSGRSVKNSCVSIKLSITIKLVSIYWFSVGI